MIFCLGLCNTFFTSLILMIFLNKLWFFNMKSFTDSNIDLLRNILNFFAIISLVSSLYIFIKIYLEKNILLVILKNETLTILGWVFLYELKINQK